MFYVQSTLHPDNAVAPVVVGLALVLVICAVCYSVKRANAAFHPHRHKYDDTH